MSPIGNHWIKFAYVNLGFFTIIAIMVYYISIKEIRQNWSKYRCNPMFMPFSENVMDDFEKCITSVQDLSTDRFLAPLTEQSAETSAKVADGTAAMGGYTTSLTDISSSFANKLSGVENTFTNGSIEFQRMSYSIKDMMSKIVGISTTLLYVLDANAKTFGSIWNGVPGKTMRKLALLGHCFHPDTKLKLKTGEIVSMKNVMLGSILEDGSKVLSVMKIDNTTNSEPLMKIKTSGLFDIDTFIYVTGSHLIKSKIGIKFQKVHTHPDAKHQSIITSDWYSCLITDTHLIKIGSQTFWDWEDYYCNID